MKNVGSRTEYENLSVDILFCEKGFESPRSTKISNSYATGVGFEVDKIQMVFLSVGLQKC